MTPTKLKRLATAARKECLTERAKFCLEMALDMIERAREEEAVRQYRELMATAGQWFVKGLAADERAEGAKIAELARMAEQKARDDELSRGLRRQH